ncbi:MAG: hypothetical protein R6W95_10880 [Desulfosarcina sp.]
MGELNVGQIILVVGFIVVMIIKNVLERARRRTEDPLPDQTPGEAAAVQIPRQAQATPEPPSTLRAPRVRAHESQAPSIRTPAGESGFIRKSLLRSPRDVQRGIILMTILGPCRTFDPPR